MKLQLAHDLALPVDAVTQAIAVLAKRRVGKSYTARRFTEQLLKAGQQVVVVDPKGDWWGIRSSADGKHAGLPVVILGGERGDVPLEASGGEVVAKLVVEERVSVVLDLSFFRKHEVATFMTSFLENVYRLKAKDQYRTPLMIVIDEADAIAPQKPQENEARMLGAAEDIVRRGGQRGLGCMLITQRSAVLNKNVLTQVEMIVALRTIAPQDLKALDAWVEVHGEKEQRDTLMASLPSLPVGDAWFWSPGWPTADGIFKRARVLPIETFDSGASPKAGEKRVEPKSVADVDLGALTQRMAATIERAKADDPKELRKQIAERDRQIRQLEKGTAVKTVEKTVVDQVAIDRAVAAATSQLQRRLRALLAGVQKAVMTAQHHAAKVRDALPEDLLGELAQAISDPTTPDSRGQRSGSVTNSSTTGAKRPGVSSGGGIPRQAAPAPRHSPSPSDNGDLARPHRKILDSLATLERLGVDRPNRANVAAFSGYTANGGAFNNYLGRLRALGFIDYPAPDAVALTDDGRSHATASVDVVSLSDLHEAWYRVLPAPHAKILRTLVDAHPNAMSREQLGELTGYASGGGAFNNYLGRLRSLGAIDYPTKGEVVATDLLFPAGVR